MGVAKIGRATPHTTRLFARLCPLVSAADCCYEAPHSNSKHYCHQLQQTVVITAARLQANFPSSSATARSVDTAGRLYAVRICGCGALGGAFAFDADVVAVGSGGTTPPPTPTPRPLQQHHLPPPPHPHPPSAVNSTASTPNGSQTAPASPVSTDSIAANATDAATAAASGHLGSGSRSNCRQLGATGTNADAKLYHYSA